MFYLFFHSKEPCVLLYTLVFVEIKIKHKCFIYSFFSWSRVYKYTSVFVEIKIEHKCSIYSFSSWSRVSALPRRPAAYKAAALLTELTRLIYVF